MAITWHDLNFFIGEIWKLPIEGHDLEKVKTEIQKEAYSSFNNYNKLTPSTQDVNWTYIRRPGRLLNVLCKFNLRPVSPD